MVPSHKAAVADHQSKTTWNVEHLRLAIEAAGVMDGRAFDLWRLRRRDR